VCVQWTQIHARTRVGFVLRLLLVRLGYIAVSAKRGQLSRLLLSAIQELDYSLHTWHSISLAERIDVRVAREHDEQPAEPAQKKP